MGMFDTVEFGDRVEFPDFPEDATRELQTKDLECNLDVYRIRDDGQVLVRAHDSKDEEPATVSGTLSVYGYAGKVWIEYAVTFAGGRFVIAKLRGVDGNEDEEDDA